MKPLPYNNATRTKKNTQQAKALKLMAICLMLFTGCSCNKQSPLKAYRYTPPPPPPPPQDTLWNWTKLNWGGVEAEAVIVDPTNGSIVYVASRNAYGGIWKSYDGGGTFTKVWALGAFGGMAIDPNSPQVIYAACAGYGVWRSRDGGSTWFQLTNLYSDYVQPDRFDSSYIYAGSWRSTDYGASWSLMIPFGTYPDAEDLVQSWQNPNVLYAGRRPYGNNKLTLKSTDRGNTWFMVDAGGAGYWRMDIDPWDDKRVYYVAYYYRIEDTLSRTSNGGTTWEKYPVGRDTLGSSWIPVAVDPRRGLRQVIYAGGEGVHRSVDYGKTWKTIGLEGMLVRDIAVDPTAPTNTTILYVAAPCFNPPCDRIYRGSPGK
jgi:hypothetical protein